MAAGASTAVIICQDEGALDRSSTSAADEAATCWRSLALGLAGDPEVACWLGDFGLAAVDDGGGVVVVVVVEVVVLLVVDGVVVDVVVEDEDLLLRPLWLAGLGKTGAPVSLALRWPKLAASLLVISVTPPLSAPLAALTVTNLTRAKLVAVGVDLITRRRMRCCSPEATKTTAAKATVKLMMSFIVRLQQVGLDMLIGGLLILIAVVPKLFA